ncbi:MULTISPECIES: DNA methyltransferase [Spirulina sp. CCY15215]|uniref:DNA methyltransferase n=1 Tax=Spirulina sp. CCY15215 TaxID=2767591 RepID=UPI0019508282|nr:DNA methyltransferase [Spirulina major]
MYVQLKLFEDSLVDSNFSGNLKRHQYPLEEIDIGNITFTGGQQESIHRWYRLTPSFSPSLVRHFIQYFNIDTTSLILDPFSGRGTTAIECQKHHIPCIGFEINPLLQRVGEYSLTWMQSDISLFSDYLKILKDKIQEFRDRSLEEILKYFSTNLPNIHNVFRWWKPEVLKDLIVAKQLSQLPEFKNIQTYLWLAINSASLDCANIHRNHPTITFDDNHDRKIDVYKYLHLRISEIETDLQSLSSSHLNANNLNKIELQDSCLSISKQNQYYQKITHLITSPPYPNRYSYVHQTRPQLHFMEVIKERQEATEIDLKTIGGTWGRATSNLNKHLIIPNRDILEILDYFPTLRERSLLMCNYATKYFLDLNEHIKHLKEIVSPQFYGAYVVGNSRLSGVEIFTETILARLFEYHGFKVKKIIVFRKRGGRKRLYETAVIIKL